MASAADKGKERAIEEDEPEEVRPKKVSFAEANVPKEVEDRGLKVQFIKGIINVLIWIRGEEGPKAEILFVYSPSGMLELPQTLIKPEDGIEGAERRMYEYTLGGLRPRGETITRLFATDIGVLMLKFIREHNEIPSRDDGRPGDKKWCSLIEISNKNDLFHPMTLAYLKAFLGGEKKQQ